MTKIYDRHLQSCGIKGGQFTLLRIIGHRGETTNSELQDTLLMDQTTLTRNLRPLIRDGYVEVSQGEDRRIKLLSLTPQGRKLLARATREWRAAQKEVKQRLGRDITRQLLASTGAVANLVD